MRCVKAAPYLFRRAIIAALAYSAPIYAKPPVCVIVTAAQTGPDGKNTAAIQQRLDDCNTKYPGQTAVEWTATDSPEFTRGPLYLPGNVVLWLGSDVVLNASTDPADF